MVAELWIYRYLEHRILKYILQMFEYKIKEILK